MTTPSNDIGGLITKLAAIMAGTERMSKDERNPQGWSYTSVMDMLDAVRPAMAKHGLAMVPDVEACEWTEGQSARGTAMTTCHMTVRWTVYDGATGASISFRTIGEAIDSSDKSTNKAMTAAQKLAVSKLVMMSTGDAEDADAVHEERVARSDAPRRDAPAPHGICPDHGIPYFKTEKMSSPAHKLDGNRWCNKPELGAGEAHDARMVAESLGWDAPVPVVDETGEPPTPNRDASRRRAATATPSAQVAAANAAAQAGFGTRMPAAAVAAPLGMCERHKTPWYKPQRGGALGHYYTEGDKRVWCHQTTPKDAPPLVEQAAEYREV